MAAVFFVSYVGLGVWLFMSMLLASVYDAYMEGHERKVVKTRVHEQMNLLMAFGILQDKSKPEPTTTSASDPASAAASAAATSSSTPTPPSGSGSGSSDPSAAAAARHHHLLSSSSDESEAYGYLSFNRFCRVMEYVRPYASREELRVIYECLDRTGTGRVDSEAFLALADVLRYRLKKVSMPTRAERARMSLCRRWYANASEPALGWNHVVDSRPFRWGVKLMIVANIVVLCLWDAHTSEHQVLHCP